MFRITASSCLACNLAEILIMAAMNAEASGEIREIGPPPYEPWRSSSLRFRTVSTVE